MLGPDCWLTGAEKGFSNYPMWHGVDTTDNTTHGRPIAADATHGNPHGTWFKVWESDCSNYNGCHPWFFGGDNPQPLSLMMSHWESTYGLGHNYILNMPPSRDGVITPKMAASAAAFGTERHRRYGAGSSAPDERSQCELARAGGRLAQWHPTSDGTGNEAELVLVLGKPSAVDRIFLSEDVVHDGQLVGQYVVDACTAPSLAGCGEQANRWRTLVGPAESTSTAPGGSRPIEAHANGGQTIGTHHIDVINASWSMPPASGFTFVRLRLLEVLPAQQLPLVSFRALRVTAAVV